VRFLSIEPLIGRYRRDKSLRHKLGYCGRRKRARSSSHEKRMGGLDSPAVQGYGVPFFFKQWGGVRKVKRGRELDGRTYDEYPRRELAPVPDRTRCAAFAENFLNSFPWMIRGSSSVPVGV
jgi:protein gp37